MLEDFLLPIFICVVLPVTCVFLAMNARKHEITRKTEVMLKAIESGKEIDLDMFKGKKRPQTIKERLLGRFTAACILALVGCSFIALGIVGLMVMGWDKDITMFFIIPGAVLAAVAVGLLISFFMGKRMLSSEIAAEAGKTENNPKEN